MRRRDFIKAATVSAVTWPLAARGQQPERIRSIGVLMPYAKDNLEGQARLAAFIRELRQLGWTDGRNVKIEYRWDPGDLKKAATEILTLSPDVILANATPAVAALQQTTHTVPIVFTQVADPVSAGFVASLAKPGGNVTGFTNFDYNIAVKWVELLKEIAPQLSHVAMLYNSTRSIPQLAYHQDAIKTAGASFGVTTELTAWEDIKNLEQAMSALGQKPNTGLIVIPTSHTSAEREVIISLANRYRMPAMYPFAFWVRDGGLISYGVDLPDLHRRAAAYIDRILKGATPSDLPVQLPIKFEMTINLKTATALGVNVPPALFALADEVIG